MRALLLAAGCFAALLAGLTAPPPVQAAGILPSIISSLQACKPGSYTGLGDALSGGQLFIGARAYNAAHVCTPGVVVCMAGDIACEREYYNGTGDLAFGPMGKHCDNLTHKCTVQTFYDSTGTGANFTQATIGSRATLLLACINTSLPCFTAIGGASYTATITSLSSPYSFAAVAERTGAFSSYNMIIGAPGSFPIVAFDTTASQLIIQQAASNFNYVVAADSVVHSIQAALNGTSSIASVDGTNTALASLNAGPSGTSIQIFTDGAGHALTGKFMEGTLYNFAYTTGNLTTVCHNQRLYYATGGSC